ncbi:AraC family transcriptional regulator [Paenibacillus sedimenti]|uniref:AraC family transcriptional regulator n=1 Tax=Paenibacillus sedimenti TaxID=2770274 RepID=A0A926QML7_9BACL|nr:AraC family transcriptional regulator [Paenibacillus sedimenti]MBD0384058.1 AraC family transcriptional regulator [Paenibacillus sedimenti]
MYRHYYLPPFDEYSFFCFPHSVGKFTQPLDHNVNRGEGVRDFSLHFVVGGKGNIELNGTNHTLKEGDVFLHTPFQRMRYYTSEDDRWVIYWIQFNGSTLANFLLERGFYESSIWYMKEIGSLEQSWLELLDEIEENNFMRPAKISSLTYAVLNEFMFNAIPFSNKRGTNHVDRISKLLPIMQNNAHLPFNLEEWAEKANLTPNYFCSLFKKITKMTPLTYITKCRIQKSKKMLLSDPNILIKEVAINSGYPSISYFNKIFMEMEGMTPNDFRTNHFK